MLEYLSRPVAFATAPLAPEDPKAKSRVRDGSSSSDTDPDDPISKKISRGINLVKAAHSRMLTRYDSSVTGSDTEAASGSSTFPPPPQPSHAIELGDDWDDDVRAFEGMRLRHRLSHKRITDVSPDDDMADSFCLIPGKSEPNATSLKEENAQLKAELEKQRQQLENMEKALKARQEQDQHLRDSIMLARKEVRLVFPHPSQPLASILSTKTSMVWVTSPPGTPCDDLIQRDSTTGTDSSSNPRTVSS